MSRAGGGGRSPVCPGSCHRSDQCSAPNAGRGYGEQFAASEDAPLGEGASRLPAPRSLARKRRRDGTTAAVGVTGNKSLRSGAPEGVRPAERVCCSICVTQPERFPTAPHEFILYLSIRTGRLTSRGSEQLQLLLDALQAARGSPGRWEFSSFYINPTSSC